MSDISQKSIATLIDELVTASNRCWHSQDDLYNPDPVKALAAARRAQETNKRRSELMRAIDQRLGDGGTTVSEKTY